MGPPSVFEPTLISPRPSLSLERLEQGLLACDRARAPARLLASARDMLEVTSALSQPLVRHSCWSVRRGFQYFSVIWSAGDEQGFARIGHHDDEGAPAQHSPHTTTSPAFITDIHGPCGPPSEVHCAGARATDPNFSLAVRCWWSCSRRSRRQARWPRSPGPNAYATRAASLPPTSPFSETEAVPWERISNPTGRVRTVCGERERA